MKASIGFFTHWSWRTRGISGVFNPCQGPSGRLISGFRKWRQSIDPPGYRGNLFAAERIAAQGHPRLLVAGQVENQRTLPALSRDDGGTVQCASLECSLGTLQDQAALVRPGVVTGKTVFIENGPDAFEGGDGFGPGRGRQGSCQQLQHQPWKESCRPCGSRLPQIERKSLIRIPLPYLKQRKKDIHEGARRTTRGHEGVGEGSRGIRQGSGRGKRLPSRALKHPFSGYGMNSPRDSGGLEKTRTVPEKGHQERREWMSSKAHPIVEPVRFPRNRRPQRALGKCSEFPLSLKPGGGGHRIKSSLRERLSEVLFR